MIHETPESLSDLKLKFARPNVDFSPVEINLALHKDDYSNLTFLEREFIVEVEPEEPINLWEDIQLAS